MLCKKKKCPFFKTHQQYVDDLIKYTYENDEKYSFRLIYNQGEYICLEPQNCMANCQNSPFERGCAGFDFLKPKEIKRYYSRIRVFNGDMRN